MKKHILKLLIVVILISLPQIQGTNSSYSDTETTSMSATAACWAPPTVPVLTSPVDGTYAGLGSSWDTNPVMDWEDSNLICPDALSVEYQYEVYSDAGLTTLLYQSVWLSTSYIPAPGTPEGSYYWRVRARDDKGYVSEFSSAWKLVVDRTAPVISDVSPEIDVVTPKNPNDIKADVSWVTNENATSNLDWRTGSLDPWTPLPDDPTADSTTHLREMTGLSTETTYYIRIRSADMAGNESTAETTVTTDSLQSSTAPTDDIVINEFLPDPTGIDDAIMPNGEWVELYNRGTTDVDVTGWVLTDDHIPGSSDPHYLWVTSLNTTNSDGSGLTIKPNGFLVVYQNKDPDFFLNNGSSGDEVNLYDASKTLIDSHTYTGPVPEGKSFVRFPDGADDWYDPIPTPGRPNILELQLVNPVYFVSISSIQEEPSITNFSVGPEGKTVSFSLSHIGTYTKLNYILSYSSYNIVRGIGPSDVTLSGDDDYISASFDLATCSSGVCTYDAGVTNFMLEITLTDQSGKEIILEQSF